MPTSEEAIIGGPIAERASKTIVKPNKQHCFFVFHYLTQFFNNRDKCEEELKAFEIDNRQEKCKVFVTLYKFDDKINDYKLRGCIGSFESMDLDHALSSLTHSSAFQDHRFSELDASELQKLKATVSILTDDEPYYDSLKDPLGKLLDIDVDRYGMIINLKNGKNATYLPKVGNQFENTEEMFKALIKKAKEPSGELSRIESASKYESNTCEAEYKEYLESLESKPAEGA